MAQSLDSPLDLGRAFDLVISLEVAEHLPESAADAFIDSLVRHGDVILFSAAIPFQGGHRHINEQRRTGKTSLFKPTLQLQKLSRIMPKHTLPLSNTWIQDVLVADILALSVLTQAKDLNGTPTTLGWIPLNAQLRAFFICLTSKRRGIQNSITRT
jgi:2-polyprenyl-3-methyl-5-hydroxy-6-metoxy-1,4-benzoquinol methylase